MLTALLLSATLSSVQTPILPPLIPWNGASRALVVAKNDPWITPSERDDLKTTPRYDETVAYLQRLVKAAPQLRMISLGKSAEGRDVWMVVASKEKNFTPQTIHNKPVILAQGGIHAGEIDGKDAGLMLLRDLTVRGTKRDLLDRVNLLFVPIFNVDGHERFTKYSRINQRGPEVSGWRTNARNLNLNRDYMKADAEEMQAMIRAIDTWQPDMYIDLHVTDGADYQYDVTYGWNGPAGHSPAIAQWLDSKYRKPVDDALRAQGHIPGPLIFTDDPLAGVASGQSDPRLSHGYGDARHIASILVENHSLKPYDQRVLGTYVFLEQTLRTVGAEGASLKQAIDTERNRRPASVPLSWKVPDNGLAEQVEILGIASRRVLSPVSGDVRVEWLGKAVSAKAPFQKATEAATSVAPAKAYWIPSAWREVIAKLDLHGIRYEKLSEAKEVDVTMVRLLDPKFTSPQFEGHVRVTATEKAERRRERFPAGSVRVPTDQPLGTLATLLLEPSSPDSLFQWGFFDSILAPTEYVEAYIMEPMAEAMMKEDPKLAEEFQKKLQSDEQFRGDARERLQWFYERTPWYDERARLYPVGKEN
ncbi:MAG TPA: M14 family metallopeptidase [Thermoanaerobaculia bacterium]|nr:M14 family metallopeptidase [Thermoanaerobaculia bacterium]